MAYMAYLASKLLTSLIQLKFEPICSFSRSASQSRFSYLQFRSGMNEKHREAYPRTISRYGEPEPTPVHRRDRWTPLPFWLIGILDHQYILGCVRSSVKKGVKYIRRHTLVGADSVVKDLSILVTPDLQFHLIRTWKSIC